jgi:pimeloyl-ACP methyl ester carboxylesterase
VEPSNSSADIRSTDHFISHTSTVPANAGQHVKLFVRESVSRDRFNQGNEDDTPLVLMISGSTQAAVPPFDLAFENYSWMAFLAHAGFDVFAMDLTGYGLSPRPEMDNPCNTSSTDQKLLIPNPLAGPCAPSYPFTLTTTQSDLDEIDTVVHYIRQHRGGGRVNLIGWSLGGERVGGYAAQHPDEVDRLFLYAPTYDPKQPSAPPTKPLEPGVPTSLRTVASFIAGWDKQVSCQNQVTPAVRDVLRSTILQMDPIGSTWGTQPLWRAPNQSSRWGWNRQAAQQVNAPTLIIRGDLDMNVPENQPLQLLNDLTVKQKVFVHVACAAHQLVWENQHMVLLRASEEWLRHGTFAGRQSGAFSVDSQQQVHGE